MGQGYGHGNMSAVRCRAFAHAVRIQNAAARLSAFQSRTARRDRIVGERQTASAHRLVSKPTAKMELLDYTVCVAIHILPRILAVGILPLGAIPGIFRVPCDLGLGGVLWKIGSRHRRGKWTLALQASLATEMENVPLRARHTLHPPVEARLLIERRRSPCTRRGPQQGLRRGKAQIASHLSDGLFLQAVKKPVHCAVHVIGPRPCQLSADLLLLRVQTFPHGVQMKDVRVLVGRLLRPGPTGKEYGKNQNKQH